MSQIKSGHLFFFVFLFFAAVLIALFVFLNTLKIMQKEIVLNSEVNAVLVQKLMTTPTPTASVSATVTPTAVLKSGFRSVASPSAK